MILEHWPVRPSQSPTLDRALKEFLLDGKARQLFEEILHREPHYVGSYYHLAKLLERVGEEAEAIKVYEKGMDEAKKAGDNHAFGELRGAYEELTF